MRSGYSRKAFFRAPSRSAFTLMEIMVVVAIIGIIMAAGAPTLYKALHKEGFRKTVSEIQEVCTSARARAIMQGQTTEVIFHPHDRTCEVAGGGVSKTWAHSTRIDESARIEMLDVNLSEYKDAAEVHVRFYPNGTSDEMTMVLVSDRNEWCKIEVELTTGLTSVDTDPRRWR